MKLKGKDGIVREFQVSLYTADRIIDIEGKCCKCGKLFGFHDTKILKTMWKNHVCKIK